MSIHQEDTSTSPTVLLVETNHDLRKIEQLVIEGLGFAVDATDDIDRVGEIAARTRPAVVVLGVPYNVPRAMDAVDQLWTRPDTETIPVVVVSTSEQRAAAAQASPNVRYTVVAPYDIDELEAAVQGALRHPPPPVILPKPQRPVSPGVRHAASEMTRNVRRIVLDALREIRQTEPYSSRFPQISIGLIDDLATILGAIFHGMEHGLTPAEVFGAPEIFQSVDNHVQLRKSQGLGPVSAILEDQILENQIDRFIATMIGTPGFTGEDAFAAAQAVREYVAELIRVIIQKYAT